MIEIFNDISEEVKARAKFWFEVAFAQSSMKNTITMLKEYRDSCNDEHERDFVDFYFNMRMEQLIEKEGNN